MITTDRGGVTMETANLSMVRPPGFYIREELEARGWTQRDLAYVLGCTEQAVNVIVSGKRGISPEMAKALGQAFDVAAEFFVNLQKSYDLSRAHDPDPGVWRRARLQNPFPVREMIRRGWLQDTDAALLEVQMAKFFECATADEIPHLSHAAKKTSYYEDIPAAQLVWLFRVRQIAKSVTVPGRYSQRLLSGGLAELKQLIREPEETRRVPQILAQCGVRFVLVEPLPGAKIDGVCFWLGPGAPVIGMSMRFDRIDNFWFVVRHELEHVLRGHGRTHEIVDDDIEGSQDGDVPETERIANTAAADFCIPTAEMDLFIARKQPFFSERDIIGFARRLQVHPGLVVGQVQRRTGRFDLLRKHQVKCRQFILSTAIVDGWGHVHPVTM